MDIIIKLAFKFFLNPFSLFIYDNSQNVILILVTCFLYILLGYVLSMLYKKNKRILCIFIFIFICSISFISYYSYNRGGELNEIRNNGFLLLKYIEKLRIINNRYPYNIDEIYTYISDNSPNNLEKILKTKNTYYYYNKNTNDENYQIFNLTIYDDMLGFDYFAYRVNPIRFELTDD